MLKLLSRAERTHIYFQSIRTPHRRYKIRIPWKFGNGREEPQEMNIKCLGKQRPLPYNILVSTYQSLLQGISTEDMNTLEELLEPSLCREFQSAYNTLNAHNLHIIPKYIRDRRKMKVNLFNITNIFGVSIDQNRLYKKSRLKYIEANIEGEKGETLIPYTIINNLDANSMSPVDLIIQYEIAFTSKMHLILENRRGEVIRGPRDIDSTENCIYSRHKYMKGEGNHEYLETHVLKFEIICGSTTMGKLNEEIFRPFAVHGKPNIKQDIQLVKPFRNEYIIIDIDNKLNGNPLIL